GVAVYSALQTRLHTAAQPRDGRAEAWRLVCHAHTVQQRKPGTDAIDDINPRFEAYRRSVSCAIDVCAYPRGQANVTAQLPRSVKPSTSNPVITRRKQGGQGILTAQATSVHKHIFVAIRHTRH